MINALGLLEVDGMVVAIDAADAMLKTASVRLLSREVLDLSRLMLVVEGDLAMCRAALNTNCTAAMYTGRVINHKEIGRPNDNTQWLVTDFSRQPKQPVREPDALIIITESADELLVLLASIHQGMTAREVAVHFDWPLEEVGNALEQPFPAGTLCKRSSRYRLKPHQPVRGTGCPTTPGINVMKKTRTANLHHLHREPLPEDLKLTPKVEVDSVHRRQTTDVYEHALAITAWQQIHDQLHPGKFHGRFTETLLDDIQVFREYTGLALRQPYLVWPSSFWFGIPATCGEQGFIGSQYLGNVETATRPGGTEFELGTPDDCTILGMMLSKDVITRQANLLHSPDRVLHMLRNQSALEVKEQHKATLRGFVQRALTTFCENPENLHQPAVRRVLGGNLLMAMGAMLEDARPVVTAKSISHQSYRRLLSRTREYVLESTSEPVTVLDLYNQLYASRRTLQDALHAILGIGPDAWLRRIRLNATRRGLMSPWSQSTTVKDAAMQQGFWHLGQFATDYQQLFAEKPSLTLHQRVRE